MFIFHVEATTPQLLLEKIAEQLIGIGMIQAPGVPGASVGTPVPAAPATEVAAEPARPPISQPSPTTAPAASGTTAPAASGTTAPAASGTTMSPSDLRTKIRAAAGPLMTGPKAKAVRDTIAQYGPSVSGCPDDSLAALLADIEGLA